MGQEKIGIVEADGVTIEYSVIRTSRRSIGLIVRPTGDVEVRAPKFVADSRIREMVVSRIGWIVRQRERFAAMGDRFAPKTYSDGEIHRYLGRTYILKIEIATKESVTLDADNITVRTKDSERVAALLDKWYRDQALRIFPPVINERVEEFYSRHGLRPSSVTIRKMRSRWGSCSSQRKILLSSELIKFPPLCIEYVAVHELCHLIHHDHGRGFYDLLTEEMPEWKELRQMLNGKK